MVLKSNTGHWEINNTYLMVAIGLQKAVTLKENEKIARNTENIKGYVIYLI